MLSVEEAGARIHTMKRVHYLGHDSIFSALTKMLTLLTAILRMISEGHRVSRTIYLRFPRRNVLSESMMTYKDSTFCNSKAFISSNF